MERKKVEAGLEDSGGKRTHPLRKKTLMNFLFQKVTILFCGLQKMENFRRISLFDNAVNNVTNVVGHRNHLTF